MMKMTRRNIFWHFNVPENTGDNLGLPPTEDDVKKYFNDSTFNILIKLQLRGAPLQNVETQFAFSFGAQDKIISLLNAEMKVELLLC